MKPKEVERISKALGDPHRLRIMQEIKKQEWLPCSQVCDMLNLAQPSVSHHIKQLVDCGIVISEKEGRNTKYSIDKEVFKEYITYLNNFV